ncbi:DUF5105 domain-containing protein [Anaeromicropila populeti]|uniref:Uncharacterized protein n=1 Tax=Anaeromicropila populeti TaxID=37658 RepID=A0A1I6IKE5_9FIRM|nr:DUF5105 domain-containing protein [Anaeromicropila populeti]SFR67173.1 protein of unknown function [Anaeromicropila populeti]
MRKRNLFITVLLFIALMTSGCFNKKPEDKVKDMLKEAFSSLTEYDLAAAKQYFSEWDEELLATSSDIEDDPLIDYLVECHQTTKYEINSIDIADDKATVELDFNYIDNTNFTNIFAAKVFQKALDNELSDSTTEEEGEEVYRETISEIKEELNPSTVESTFTLQLSKIDDEWKISELTDELVKVITTNISETTE